MYTMLPNPQPVKQNKESDILSHKHLQSEIIKAVKYAIQFHKKHVWMTIDCYDNDCYPYSVDLDCTSEPNPTNLKWYLESMFTEFDKMAKHQFRRSINDNSIKTISFSDDSINILNEIVEHPLTIYIEDALFQSTISSFFYVDISNIDNTNYQNFSFVNSEFNVIL